MKSASAALRADPGAPNAVIGRAERARPAASAVREVMPEALPAAACHYELVTTRAGFDSLAAEWNDLFDRAGRGSQVFQTFNWNWHWCNHYLRGGDERDRSLSILIGRRSGRLVMVWPLISVRVAGLLQLAWMGEPVSQYGDVLMESSLDAPALLRAAWAYIIASIKPDLVWLPKVREDAAVAPLIGELGAFATQRRSAPYAHRDDPGSTPATSAKKRRTLARRLARLGATVDFRKLAGSPAARDLALQTLEWKRNQLKQRGIVSPALADARLTAFFADVADGRGMPAGCRVLALESDGEPVAAGIFIAAKDHIASHVAAFDARFEKASVGMMLLERAATESFAEGFETFDLLPPADAYKARLAHAEIDVIDWAVPTSLKGSAYARLYLALARPLIKSILRELPGPVRRFVAARYPG